MDEHELPSPWPRNRLLSAIAFVWSFLPLGLLGLLGAIVFRVVGWGRLRWRAGALEVLCRGPFATWRTRSGWAAFTLGWTIFYWDPEHAAAWDTPKHERAHVRQGLRLGPLFAVAYPLASIMILLGCPHLLPYTDNPFEHDAAWAVETVRRIPS